MKIRTQDGGCRAKEKKSELSDKGGSSNDYTGNETPPTDTRCYRQHTFRCTRYGMRCSLFLFLMRFTNQAMTTMLPLLLSCLFEGSASSRSDRLSVVCTFIMDSNMSYKKYVANLCRWDNSGHTNSRKKEKGISNP
jgi:hypothetical protein